MTTIATVCARGGSKGVPRKNVRPLFGRPLIQYTILQALATPGIDGVYVSTDDVEIADAAEAVGAVVPGLRPAHLATDDAPKIPVIEHLVSLVEAGGSRVDMVVDLQPTSPLRLTDDITNAMTKLTAGVDVVITAALADANPYYTMVEERRPGLVELVASPPAAISGRQAAPTVYAMNGSIYVWRRGSLPLGLWGGNTALHEMPRARSIDIDEDLDWLVLEAVANATGVLSPYLPDVG